MAAKQDGYHCC